MSWWPFWSSVRDLGEGTEGSSQRVAKAFAGSLAQPSGQRASGLKVAWATSAASKAGPSPTRSWLPRTAARKRVLVSEAGGPPSRSGRSRAAGSVSRRVLSAPPCSAPHAARTTVDADSQRSCFTAFARSGRLSNLPTHFATAPAYCSCERPSRFQGPSMTVAMRERRSTARTTAGRSGSERIQLSGRSPRSGATTTGRAVGSNSCATGAAGGGAVSDEERQPTSRSSPAKSHARLAETRP